MTRCTFNVLAEFAENAPHRRTAENLDCSGLRKGFARYVDKNTRYRNGAKLCDELAPFSLHSSVPSRLAGLAQRRELRFRHTAGTVWSSSNLAIRPPEQRGPITYFAQPRAGG